MACLSMESALSQPIRHDARDCRAARCGKWRGGRTDRNRPQCVGCRSGGARRSGFPHSARQFRRSRSRFVCLRHGRRGKQTCRHLGTALSQRQGGNRCTASTGHKRFPPDNRNTSTAAGGLASGFFAGPERACPAESGRRPRRPRRRRPGTSRAPLLRKRRRRRRRSPPRRPRRDAPPRRRGARPHGARRLQAQPRRRRQPRRALRPGAAASRRAASRGAAHSRGRRADWPSFRTKHAGAHGDGGPCRHGKAVGDVRDVGFRFQPEFARTGRRERERDRGECGARRQGNCECLGCFHDLVSVLCCWKGSVDPGTHFGPTSPPA